MIHRIICDTLAWHPNAYAFSLVRIYKTKPIPVLSCVFPSYSPMHEWDPWSTHGLWVFSCIVLQVRKPAFSVWLVLWCYLVWRTILSIAVVHPNSFSIVTACNALLVCGTDPWNSVASWSVEQAKFYLFTQIMKNGGLKSQNFPNSRKGGSKFYIFLNCRAYLLTWYGGATP